MSFQDETPTQPPKLIQIDGQPYDSYFGISKFCFLSADYLCGAWGSPTPRSSNLFKGFQQSQFTCHRIESIFLITPCLKSKLGKKKLIKERFPHPLLAKSAPTFFNQSTFPWMNTFKLWIQVDSPPPTCTTPDGDSGHCMGIQSCPILIANLERLRKSVCFQSLFSIGVCCPDNGYVKNKIIF